MRRSSGRFAGGGAGWSCDPESVGLRVLSGRPLRRRHRRAGVAVVARDIDAEAGVAAVWLVRRVAGPDIVEEICQFERVGGSWRYLGGGGRRGELLLTGRPSASRAGPASLMTSLSGCSVRSSADRAARGRPGDLADVGWVACAMFRVGVEVAYLQAGARRVEVPWHGYVVVAWKAPPVSDVPARPAVAAIGEDGSRLTGLGPRDYLDSLTWAAVEAAIEGKLSARTLPPLRGFARRARGGQAWCGPARTSRRARSHVPVATK